jgi:hypothetical protein
VPWQRAEEAACYSEEGHYETRYRVPLWNGYEVWIEPAGRDPDVELRCRVTLRDARGAAVFDRTALGAKVYAGTGLDLEHDGGRDVVLEVNDGGGQHCCWSYPILSLARSPALIVEVTSDGALMFQDLDGNGRVEIKARQGLRGFDGLSQAASPFAWRVYSVENGKLADVTASFCTQLRQDEDYLAIQTELTGRGGRELREAPRERRTRTELEDTKGKVLSLVLQEVLCERREQAYRMLGRLWPPHDLTRIRKALETELSKGLGPAHP